MRRAGSGQLMSPSASTQTSEWYGFSPQRELAACLRLCVTEELSATEIGRDRKAAADFLVAELTDQAQSAEQRKKQFSQPQKDFDPICHDCSSSVVTFWRSVQSSNFIDFPMTPRIDLIAPNSGGKGALKANEDQRLSANGPGAGVKWVQNRRGPGDKAFQCSSTVDLDDALY